MKLLFILLGIIIIAFLVIQFFALKSQRGIESYPYSLVKKFDDFEIRNYEASLFTAVKMSSGRYEEISGKGFSILANYIFGGNERNQKIAMTSPVAVSLEDSMTMMFMVPKKLKKENLPKPNRTGIEFREEAEKRVATIRFKGWANSRKIEKYKNILLKALTDNEMAFSDKNIYFLGYNAPYEVFNRKNEIMVELK